MPTFGKHESKNKTQSKKSTQGVGFKKGGTEQSQASIIKQNQENVAHSREQVENLRTALMKVSYQKASSFPKKQLETYEQRISKMCNTLNDISVMDLDTTYMDEDMLYLAEHLQGNMENGNVETTKRMMDALYYGVMIGHEEIVYSDRRKKDKIIQSRTTRYKKFRDLVKLCERIDLAVRDINKKTKQFNELSEEFDKKYEKLSEKVNENPDLVEQLDRFGAITEEVVGDEAFELWVEMQEVIGIQASAERMRNLIILSKNLIIETQQTIRNVEITLNSVVLEMDEELAQNIQEYQQNYLKQQHELQEEIRRSREVNERFTAGINEMFSARVIGGDIIAGMTKWNQLQGKIRKEQESEAAKQRVIQEQEEQNMQNQMQRLL